MALFGKKLSLDEILKGIESLSDEEKAQVKAKMEDIDKAEDEREIDKVEEEKADNEEVKDEKAEEVKEESKEIGKDVDEVEEKTEEPVEEVKEDEQTEELDKAEEENKEDVMGDLAARVSEIEKRLEYLDDLKDKMEEYTRKQAETFGYKGGTSNKKEYGDMTADELAKELKSEI